MSIDVSLSKMQLMRQAMDEHAMVARAKELAAGELGEKLAKFPLLFSKAVFFGRRPSMMRKGRIWNGSVTLVDLGAGPLAVTCQHVISCFRRMRKCSNKVLFQIGSVELDPLAQLVDEDRRIDLATIRLTPEQAKTLTSEGEIGSCIFHPRTWPSPLLKKGEFVAFGGFPGALRTPVSCDEIAFGTWSSGASEVSSVSEYQFVSAFDRDDWVKSFGVSNRMDFKTLGGMSGGPAFVKRHLYWDFVGIVSEYNANYDAVFFSSAGALHADGTIEHPPI